MILDFLEYNFYLNEVFGKEMVCVLILIWSLLLLWIYFSIVIFYDIFKYVWIGGWGKGLEFF